MPDHILLNFINKMSVCAEPGLKSAGQRFSEAAIVNDSVITAKSRRSPDSSCPAVLCMLHSKTQPEGVDGCRGMEQTCSRVVLERTCNQWNPRVSGG